MTMLADANLAGRSVNPGLQTTQHPADNMLSIYELFGSTPPAKFQFNSVDQRQMHELTLQQFVGQRVITQEALIIRRSLNTQKLGLRYLAPLQMVNALRIRFSKIEYVPKLIQRMPERTTGRGTSWKSNTYERQLDRYGDGDHFGMDLLLENGVDMLAQSRATNLDGVLSTLDYAIWREARNAHNMWWELERTFHHQANITQYIMDTYLEREELHTFLFNREEHPLQLLQKKTIAYQNLYGGQGNAWFLHLFSDMNLSTGHSEDTEFYRAGPGNKEALNAPPGEGISSITRGTPVYIMQNMDVYGIGALEVLENTLQIGEWYNMCEPTGSCDRANYKSSDRDVWLMDLDRSCWAPITLMDAFAASGRYDPMMGTPVDVIRDNHQSIIADKFTHRVDKIDSGYYFDVSTDEQKLVRFMGQHEQYAISYASILKLAKSVAAQMGAIDQNALRVLQQAVHDSHSRKFDDVVESYLTTWCSISTIAIGKRIGNGLNPIITDMKEIVRGINGSIDLPQWISPAAAAAAGTNATPHYNEVQSAGFAIPPCAGNYAAFKAIQRALHVKRERTEFNTTYLIDYDRCMEISKALTAFETVSEELARLLPGAIINDHQYASSWWWNATNAHTLFEHTIGHNALPLFIKKSNISAILIPNEELISEMYNLANQYAHAVQRKWTGRLALGPATYHARTRMIGANIDGHAMNAFENVHFLDSIAVRPQFSQAAALNFDGTDAEYKGSANTAPDNLKKTFNNILALMFNTRPLNSTSSQDIALAERNRAIVMLLLVSVSNADDVAAQSTRLEAAIKWIHDYVAPSQTGKLSMLPADKQPKYFFDDQAELQKRLINACKDKAALHGVFDISQLRTNIAQLPSIYERYETTKAQSPPPISFPKTTTGSGDYLRTPFTFGQSQFVDIYKNNLFNIIPADPLMPDSVIDSTQLATYAKQIEEKQFERLPPALCSIDQIRRMASANRVLHHFKRLLASSDNVTNEFTLAQTDPFTGMRYSEMKDDKFKYNSLYSTTLLHGTTAGSKGLNDFVREYAGELDSDSFKDNWQKVTANAPSILVEIIAKAYLTQPNVRATYESYYNNNIMFPKRFILTRYLRVNTLSALYAMQGGEAMKTYMTFPRFYYGSDATTQEFAYNFHFWAAPVVLREEYIYWVDHVQISKYLGGFGMKTIMPNTVKTISDPSMYSTKGDIYVIEQPYEHISYPDRMPITGRREDYYPAVYSMQPVTAWGSQQFPIVPNINQSILYPNALATNLLFRWLLLSDNIAGSEAVIPGDSRGAFQPAHQGFFPLLRRGTARFYVGDAGEIWLQYSNGFIKSQYVNEALREAMDVKVKMFKIEDISRYKRIKI